MKKSLLLGMSLVLGVSINAQVSHKMSKQTFPLTKKNSLPSDVAPAAANVATVANAVAKKSTPVKTMTSSATQIGETQYDLQSNGSMGSRIVNHADGTISAVWTICPAGTPYTARGTGYNYFDGSKWLYPDTVTHDVVNRLETIRTGFPDIQYMKNAKDVIVAHATSNYTNQEGFNATKGAMPINFFQTNSTNPLGTGPHGAIWPRIAVGGAGDSTIHLIANYSDTIAMVQGIKQPMVYSRSQNSGTTWDIIAVGLPGLDSTKQLFGGGEEYSIAAKGNNVAILSGGVGNHMTLFKSTNNGTTFVRSLIDSVRGTPDYSTVLAPGDDSAATNDGAMDVMFDASNNVHVVYSGTKVGRNATGGGVFVPGTISLTYWNSIMNMKVNIPIPLSAVDADMDGVYRIGDSTTSITKCRYRNLSVLSIPNIGMDAAGNIYVTYSMPADNDTTADQQGYRDIWAVMSADGGMTWSTPTNLTSFLGMSLEQSFPVLAERVDGFMHILYQEDQEPGTALTNADPDGVNTINYLKVDVATLSIGIQKNQENDLFFVGQNFPNPLNGQTTIPVNMAKASNLTITVSNMVGQKVIELNAGNLTPGYHNIGLDANKLSAGLYFYTVKAGNFSVTKRMIVE